MTLHIRYFAILKDQAGRTEEQIETPSKTPAELYAELTACHGFTLPPNLIRVAIGDEFASMNDQLKDGDQVTFIPPVAGG